MPFTNPEPEQIRALLKSVETIAVVGFSPKPGRAKAAGMTVVMGRCIMRDCTKLCRD